MRFERLTDWLNWQESLHPKVIDLGLDRVHAVLQRLDWQLPRCPVISVAGTKGKGSCVALLESIYRSAGYRVGTFSSPHLHRYNERIHIDGREISDVELCAVFARIDAARGDISLTYFEFNTLAALLVFATAALDVWILEVGMGGRLDAVNVVDADVALVTSIGLDHTEWLGNDLDSIAREKAGIYRHGKPALFGAKSMPKAIEDVAQAIDAPLLRAGREYDHVVSGASWNWWMGAQRLEQLPLPGIAGAVQLDNASSALAVIHLLQKRLPVTLPDLQSGLSNARLSGRFEVLSASQVHLASTAEWVLDVAHNALSAQVLAAHLATRGRRPTLAILGVMGDKDIDGMLAALRAEVDCWIPVSLPGLRALPVEVLAERLRAANLPVLFSAPSIEQACHQAAQQQGIERILVCGSFMVVGPALDCLYT